MRVSGGVNLLWWSGRELLRRPVDALMTSTCLLALTLVVAVPLQITQALAETASELLSAGPALVVRRATPAGWRPMPIEASVRSARAVVGVTRAVPRVWGSVTAEGIPVTVVGVTPGPSAPEVLPSSRPLPASAHFAPPRRGEAVVGPGLGRAAGDSLRLVGVAAGVYRVREVLSEHLGMVAQDVVFLHVGDARKLLGFSAGEASDLAIDVFHPAEQDAVIPELNDAFGFPVRISTRTRELKRYAGQVGRRGSIAALVTVPAVLAMLLVVTAAAWQARANRREVGLLKAVGWTARDVVALRLFRAMLVAVPAMVTGLAMSSLLIFTPGVTWLGMLLLGLATPPALSLSPTGALLVMLEVYALVFIPYATANLLPAVAQAATLPSELMDEGGL